MLNRVGRLAGIRHDVDPGVSKQSTVKPMEFPALISHQQMHGLPGLHVHPSRRESKIVNDDLHLLILGGTGAEAEHEEHQVKDQTSSLPRQGRRTQPTLRPLLVSETGPHSSHLHTPYLCCWFNFHQQIESLV